MATTSPARPPRALALLLALALACGGLVGLAAAVAPAATTSATVVISQVYGGGGNAGAPYASDYVELFNRGTGPAPLAGWSVQYASATGTGNFGANSGQLTELPAVTLQPGQYFLIQEAGGATGAPLPAPDATDATPINLGATGGKVALVNAVAPLGCNGGSAPCSAAQLAQIVDLVGYDGANFAEGSPAPALSNTTAASRNAGGCAETDNNAADFAAAAPAPRNAATPLAPCGAGPSPSPSPSPSPGPLRVHDIQGAAHTSPRAGQAVANVPGIVTHTRSNGFYLQDPAPDADDATSEAIFVFTSAAPTVAVGDSLLVGGTVAEFRAGGASGTNLTTTEITGPAIVRLSSGNALPAPVVLGAGGRAIPAAVIEDDAAGSVETSGTFDPASDGIDFYESLEGMLVQINDAVAVGPTSDFGSNREIPVLADNGAGAGLRTPRGGIVIRTDDFNPERVILNDATGKVTLPAVNVGAAFAGATVGVIDYSFGNFKLQVAQLAGVAGGVTPQVLPAAAEGQLAVATFNVENLDPGDGPAKFARLAGLIVGNLRAPDIVALEEVQDNNGPTNDGTVDASATLDLLVAAIQAAGGPAYQYRLIDPVDDQDGGEPGGNIRVAFLFRTDRGLAFVDRPGGCPTCAVGVAGSGPATRLTASPGRIDPTSPAFVTSRKPLAGEFRYHGRTLFVVANHFNSKGGDQPLFGRFQPPARSSEVQRAQQARIVRGFVDSILAADPSADIAVLGDLNDFPFSGALGILKGGGATALTALIETLPEAERYTYVFEGNSQALDHILVSPHLLGATAGYQVAHVNAEFADQASDHDPQVARFALPYAVCPLYDRGKVRKAGSTIPIRLQLCDAAGGNLSSPGLVLTATGVAQVDATVSGTADDAGNANPDGDFRYDPALGGYVYNLSTRGLTTGTWRLTFAVDGVADPSYAVTFDLR